MLKKRNITTDKFIEKSKNVHGNFYDYSKVEYKNNKEKVKIICPAHGEFEQRPCNHLDGRGCHICGGFAKKTTQDFIKKAIKVHGNKYNYSKVSYSGVFNKIIITCLKHGDFIQLPSNHLKGCGCPKCKLEKAKTTKEMFIENAIIFH